MKHSHHFKPVEGLQFIDVFRLLRMFTVTDPCLQHAVKTLLVAGGRGGQDISQDVQEAIDTLERWKEMREEDLARSPLAPRERAHDLTYSLGMGCLVCGDIAGHGGLPCPKAAPRAFAFNEERADIIGQNGNDGEHYGELERLQAAEDFNNDIPAGAQPVKEPERPRHLCATCSQGHATHQCTAGQKEPARSKPKAELPETDGLVDPTGKPSWDDAPSWAMWLSQDAAGTWTFWKSKPMRRGSGWTAVGLYQVFNSGELAGDWKQSLEEAPGRTVT